MLAAFIGFSAKTVWENGCWSKMKWAWSHLLVDIMRHVKRGEMKNKRNYLFMIMEVLKNINKNGTTILLVTH